MDITEIEALLHTIRASLTATPLGSCEVVHPASVNQRLVLCSATDGGACTASGTRAPSHARPASSAASAHLSSSIRLHAPANEFNPHRARPP